jgi:hypothetical protein
MPLSSLLNLESGEEALVQIPVIPSESVGLNKTRCDLYMTLTQNLMKFFVHLKDVAFAGKHVTI